VFTRRRYQSVADSVLSYSAAALDNEAFLIEQHIQPVRQLHFLIVLRGRMRAVIGQRG
jgi:hypothetical protein